jgi:hypothetical protein
MNDRINQVKADLRFWWWKVRHVHAQRYISITTIVAVLVGLTFFSFNNVQKQVFAADGSWVDNAINIVGADASYMLINNGIADGTCLWPMNRWSADHFNYKSVNPYRGKACTTTPSDLEITVNDNATLTLVGDVSVKSLSVQNNAKVTSAPTDSRGFAVPHASKSNYYASRYTGFVAIDMSVNKTTGAAARRISIYPDNGKYDDAVVIETGILSGTDYDNAQDMYTSDGKNVSIDIPQFRWILRDYDNYDSTGNVALHSSFRAQNKNGELPNELRYAVGHNPANLQSKPAFSYISTSQTGTVYIPIRVTTYEHEGGASAVLKYTIQDVDASKNVIPNASLPDTPQNFSTTIIYGPKESDAVTSNVGKVDTGAPKRVRYEYATAPIGEIPGNGGEYYTIDRDLSGYYWSTSSGSNRMTSTPIYNFFSRVVIGAGGTMTGFKQEDYANNTFFMVFDDASETKSGSPFSNTKRSDGRGYNFGLFEENGSVYQPHYLQNYKLQNHSDTVATGIKGGLRLVTSGNVSVVNGGSIDVSGKGLPGGVNYLNNSVSVPGIGGKAGSTIFGSYPIAHNDWTEFGSNWADGNGGGGGHNGHVQVKHSGGGGGGVIGYGGGAYTASGADVRVANNSVGQMSRPGLGGGGYLGYGGGVDSSGNVPNISGVGDNTGTLNGTSYRGSYNGGAFDAVAMALGGGGASSSQYPNEMGGAGGGSIKMTVGGDLSINNASIVANGASGTGSGAGAGGGGSINVKVTGTFDLSSNSTLSSAGGGSFNQKWTDGADCPSTSSDCYAVPGNGGGGLIRVSASNYASTLANAGDSGAWPNSGVFCTPSGMMNTYINNTTTAHKSLNIGAGGSGGEPGIIDLGATYCSGGSSSGSNLQISKQVQQYLSGSPSSKDDITSDGKWYNGLTLTSGKYIRVKIYVTNLSTSAMTGVTVTDTLPIDSMTLFDYGGGNNIVVVSGGNKTELAATVNAATISVSPLTVPANGTIVVEYATQVK